MNKKYALSHLIKDAKSLAPLEMSKISEEPFWEPEVLQHWDENSKPEERRVLPPEEAKYYTDKGYLPVYTKRGIELLNLL